MGPQSRFRDHAEAARRLATALRAYAGDPDVRILALPRGGVPVAYEVARALHAPLDVFIVRKLGLPGHEELAMGAIASGGIIVLNDDVVHRFGVNEAPLRRVKAAEQRELERRERQYRGGRPPADIAARTVILVDDGLATGSTMQAAVVAVRQQRPKHLVVAVPIASPEACEAFRDVADETVCAVTPEPFHGVGRWYDDFSQTTDEEVHELLEDARALGPARAPRVALPRDSLDASKWRAP